MHTSRTHSVRRWIKIGSLIAALGALSAAHPGEHGAPPAPTSPAAAAPADGGTAVGIVTAFHSALTRGDTGAALALLAEDALIFEAGGVERGRAEYARHHLAADAAFSAAVTRTLINRRSGEDSDTAWVMSVETVTGSFRGRAIHSRSVETMLLRRVDSRWQIAHIHWSSDDLPPI